MDSVTKKVLAKIKPSEEEHKEFENVVLKLKRKIRKASKKQGIECEPFVGGSFGKNTYLKGSFDADVFCRFDKSYDDEKLSVYLETILKEANIKFKRQKGSRDYFSGLFGSRKLKVKFEAVPVRRIKKAEEAVNSTDVSSLHVEFIKKKAVENPKLTDEIRLAKQFFKAKKLYGAESYIGGFSGHVIDILIAYYGSLDGLLCDAKMWTDSKVIDINNFYKSEEDAIKGIGNDKNSSLVLIDPIIKERNAARALSSENYARFLIVAISFDKFSERDFEIVKEDFNEVIDSERKFAKECNLSFIAYQFKFAVKNESEDIVGSKLKRLFGKVEVYFKSFDFNIFRNRFFIDIEKGVCLFIFEFEKGELPWLKKVSGPKVYMKDAIEKFLEGKEDYFVEDSRVCTYERRRVTKISEVCNLGVVEFEKMLGKDFSFVKNVKVLKRK